MKRRTHEKRCLYWFGVLVLLFTVCFVSSCKDDKIGSNGYDPSRPVVFSDFTPDEGSLRTQIRIYGDNFGSDPSKIHITIGGQFTTTIGCTNTEIYCMIPPKAFDGNIRINIESADGVTAPYEYEFEKKFKYVSQTAVSTLVGNEDENGNSSDVDGNFEEARFGNAEWLLMDTFGIEKCLIVNAKGGPVRRINLETEKVSTLITNGQGGFWNMQYMSFDATGDTIFISDDTGRGDRDRRQIAYILRPEEFRKAHPYVYDRTGYCNVYCAGNQSLYYNTYWKGALQKAVDDPVTQNKVGKEIFGVYENSDYGTYMSIHPDGRFMYITGRNCILVSQYNKETKEFQKPTTFVGREGEGGYSPSPGSSARFGEPYQGTFVKNDEYINNPRPDGNIYDYYLCDKSNHCIFKITPDGNVSLFAGRGSVSSDGNKHGYIDGNLKTEARFDNPCGIAYDEDTKTFYIADKENHRIRKISVE